MEQNKFEKEIKKALEQRTIQPSEMAWDRLDAMLAVAEEKKPKRNLGWLYMAATILGFILVGTIFFSQTEEVIDKAREDVVFENKATKTETPRQIEIPQTGNAAANPENTVAAIEKESIRNHNNHPSNSKQATPQAQPVAGTTNQSIGNEQQYVAQSPIINQKAEQKAISMENDKVDELLAIADTAKKEVAPTGKTTVKVDASSLLSQVDGELELSFREKVIKSVNKKFKSVKVAVSSRNQE